MCLTFLGRVTVIPFVKLPEGSPFCRKSESTNKRMGARVEAYLWKKFPVMPSGPGALLGLRQAIATRTSGREMGEDRWVGAGGRLGVKEDRAAWASVDVGREENMEVK